MGYLLIRIVCIVICFVSFHIKSTFESFISSEQNGVWRQTHIFNDRKLEVEGYHINSGGWTTISYIQFKSLDPQNSFILYDGYSGTHLPLYCGKKKRLFFPTFAGCRSKKFSPAEAITGWYQLQRKFYGNNCYSSTSSTIETKKNQ